MKFCDLVYIIEIASNVPTIRTPEAELQLGKEFILRMLERKFENSFPYVIKTVKEYILDCKTFEELVDAVNLAGVFGGDITAEELKAFIDEGQIHFNLP